MAVRAVSRMEIIESLIIIYSLHEKSKFEGLEIGCLQGEFDRYLLRKFDNLYMTSIDPFPQLEDVHNNTTDYSDRFRLVLKRSDDAFFAGSKYDFIFIDGDHSYEQTKRDIVKYTPYVRPGGLMTGHNYDQYIAGFHPGVKRAVDEIFGNRVNFVNSDVTWWVKI